MEPVQLPLHGGCVCGALRYSLSGAPLLVYACHCHDCQKRSGSAFGLTAVVASADLDIRGEREIVRMTLRSGREIDHVFCPDCRSRIMARAIVSPEYSSLRVGGFDDASWARPIAQLWVDSAIPWAVIPGVAAVAQADFDFYAQGELWRAGAPRFVTADGSSSG